MASSIWSRWQHAVVAQIRESYPDLFPYLQQEEIDWQAWQPLFEQGCDARTAVEQALAGAGRLATEAQRGGVPAIR